MAKLSVIFANAIPAIVMIGLIPIVSNDYLLTLLYVGIISISFAVKLEKKEILVFVTGFFVMIVSEYFFVSTGVETFNRNSLFGIMPLWLPFLWAYAFVAIKRGVLILSK